MKTPFFKAIIGYGDDAYIEVPQSELKAAIRAQIEGSVYLGAYGSLSGGNIIAVVPDMVRIGGYNRGYKPTPGEYESLCHSPGYSLSIAILGQIKDEITGKSDRVKAITTQNKPLRKVKFFVLGKNIAIVEDDMGNEEEIDIEVARDLINSGELSYDKQS